MLILGVWAQMPVGVSDFSSLMVSSTRVMRLHIPGLSSHRVADADPNAGANLRTCSLSVSSDRGLIFLAMCLGVGALPQRTEPWIHWICTMAVGVELHRDHRATVLTSLSSLECYFFAWHGHRSQDVAATATLQNFNFKEPA